MPTKHFAYYDDWEGTVLECPRCHWRGTFRQGSVEFHGQLMDCSCPACAWPDKPMLAIVSYPTIEESEQNWHRLSDEDRQSLIGRKQFINRWEKTRLRTPDQLPELEGAKLKIGWNCVGEEGCRDTVLTHDGIEIWREPALWEGYDRFREVVLILKQKYGERLADVVPADAAELYLYGDNLHADEYVAGIRKALKRSHARHAGSGPRRIDDKSST